MHTIKARNVQAAYVLGLKLIRQHGVLEETRNGPALVVPDPVVTTYERPCERVLLDPVRDANPFFHLLEALWMLAGRDDVESIARYNSGIARYSNDGRTFHGAYGHRWRRHFYAGGPRAGDKLDQLAMVIELLRENPGDRRVVLQMWDAEEDLGQVGADFPCNTQIYFRVRREQSVSDSVLDMTVCCRSNDAIWGAYGANAVHFSVLQEFVAAAVGVGVGRMHQLSNNLHAYVDTLNKVGEPRWARAYGHTEYEYPEIGVSHKPLFNPSPSMPVADMFRQIEAFWDGSDDMATGTFLTSDALGDLIMMRAAWRAFKNRDRDTARSCVADMRMPDWQRACGEWLERRYAES